MNTGQGKTVIITGANSGIGYEAAKQLEKAGYERVILACRSNEKAEDARKRLIAAGAKDVFEALVIDTSEPSSGKKAAEVLASNGGNIDVLILNAGMMPGSKLEKNSDGMELTFASTLAGHHALVMGLLEKGKLSEHARIIISGSEGARGEMSGMNVVDLDELAEKHFGGDLGAAMIGAAKGEPNPFKGMDAYVTAKTYVAWWAAALSHKLPQGMTVNAVSPGAAMDTAFMRNMPWLMRNMMQLIMPLIADTGKVGPAARRYLDAAEYGDDVTGKFFASPQKKMIGPLEVQPQAHFADTNKQELAWTAITKLTGVGYPASEAVGEEMS
ncbi:MAG: short-chain dehydrogenase [Bacteroidetes bacterium]|nr:MAG: short-chain dehydrogenase [Bacteroidota bacterium]